MHHKKNKIIDTVLNYNIEETIQRVSSYKYYKSGIYKRSHLAPWKHKEAKEKQASQQEEDFVVQIFTANTHAPVLFSLRGLVTKLKPIKYPRAQQLPR